MHEAEENNKLGADDLDFENEGENMSNSRKKKSTYRRVKKGRKTTITRRPKKRKERFRNISVWIVIMNSGTKPKVGFDYYKKLLSGFLIVGGVFLLLEHLFTWGFFEWGDWIGHEWYGLILIIIGFVISLKM